MSDCSLRPGDVCRLKSAEDGPLMTVEGRATDRNDYVVVIWWNERTSEFRRNSFREQQLEMIVRDLPGRG